MWRLFQRSECRVANGGVGGGDGVEMEVRGQFPGDIVVRLAVALGEILRREQIDGVIAIRLIETDDVSARGIISLFESDRILRAG